MRVIRSLTIHMYSSKFTGLNRLAIIMKMICFSHRRKSRFDLIRVCCIIVGIEFAYAAETAFVSPTLLEIGINHKVYLYIVYDTIRLTVFVI